MSAVRRILVISGDAAVGASLEQALSKEGCTITTTADGAQALKTLMVEDFGAVVAETAASGLSGFEIAAQMKAQRPWMPVVLVAATVSEDVADRARAAGAVALLGKPLSEAAVAAALSPCLAGHPETAPAGASRGAIGSLVAAPFIALVSAIVVPAAAVGGAFWLVMKRAAAGGNSADPGGTAAIRIVMFLIAPFVSLFYMGIMPMVGMMELMKLGAAAEARSGGAPRKGITGMVGRLIAGGRVWITENPGA
jgi:CheY-like chemotaxis protein